MHSRLRFMFYVRSSVLLRPLSAVRLYFTSKNIGVVLLNKPDINNLIPRKSDKLLHKDKHVFVPLIHIYFVKKACNTRFSI